MEIIYEDVYFTFKRKTDNYLKLLIRHSKDDIEKERCDIYFKSEKIILELDETGILLISPDCEVWENFFSSQFIYDLWWFRDKNPDNYKNIKEFMIDYYKDYYVKCDFIDSLIEKKNGYLLFKDYRFTEDFRYSYFYIKNFISKDFTFARSNYDIDDDIVENSDINESGDEE